MRLLLSLCLLSSVLCPLSLRAQQNPKENAEVIVAVKGAAYGVPTSDAMRLELWLTGASNQIDTTVPGAGTSAITYTSGLNTLMKPNRHYQARISPGAGSYGEIKLSAPAGYSIWIDDRPASTVRTSYPWLVFKIELRANTGISRVPAGDALPPEVAALIWQISAGTYSNGVPAGAVQWRAPDLSVSLLNANSLTYMDPGSAEVAVSWHSDGGLIELRTFQFLMYISRNSTPGTGYEVQIYSPTVVRTSGSGDGPYTYDESPYRIFRVSNPNGSTWNDQIRIERIEATTTTWTISQSGSNWTIVESSSLRTITRTSTGTSPRVETVEVKDNANVVATKLRRTYQTFGWSQEEMTEEVANPDATSGPALTTTYAYHTTSGTGGYSRLKSVTNPDGSWTRYDYDDTNTGFGNLINVYRPWQDSPSDPASATTSNCTATILSYVGERNVFNELPGGAETKILGTTSAKSTVSYAFPGNASNGQPLRTETTTLYTASAATLTTTSKVFNPTAASAEFIGRPYSQVNPDGTKSAFARYKGKLYDFGDGGLWVKKSTPPNNVVWVQYRFNGFSTSVQDSVAVTSFDGETLDTLYMVPNRSTVEILIYDDEGRIQWTVPCVFTGATSGVPAFDNTDRETLSYYQGRLHVRSRLNGFQEIDWISNGWISGHTANDGMYTAFSRDALGRMTLESKAAIAASGDYPAHPAYYIHRGYDASDRVVSEITTPSISLSPTSEAVTTTRTFNVGGLLTAQTAESGAGNFTTSHAYTNGGRTVTTTLPGGATQVTDRWRDGSAKWVTGTGVVAQYREVTINGDGTLTTATYTLRSSDIANPTAAPRWAKVTTDWVGRTIKEERPAPPSASPSTFTKQYYFNSSGQPIKSTETALADTLVDYNAWQQPYRTGLDINASGTLVPASTDRITETDTLFEKDGSNAWWTKTTTKVYNVDNSATPVTSSIVKTRLNKFTGYNQAQTVATDIFTNVTTTTLTVQRGTTYHETDLQLVTETIDHPDSTTDEVTVSRHGLLEKKQTKEGLVYRTYYDNRSRPIKTTDPRTDTSTTARIGYVTNSDRIAWRQDTAGNQTSYGYESSTGRLSTETDPLSKVARYAYTTRGERYRTWGDTAYPVELGFNDYGEQVTMKTYRGGTGWTGSTWPASPGTVDTTTWAYDPASATLTTKTDAASKAVAYTYNTRGQLATRAWARGVTTAYSYSGTTAEQIGIDYSDATTDLTYTYNRLGQSATVVDATGTRTLNYSATTTQLTSEDLPSFFSSRRISYPVAGSGVIGRPTGLQLGTSGSPTSEQSITYGYDTYGRFNSFAGAGTTFAYGYMDNSNLLASITNTSAAWGQTRTYLSNRDLLDVIETTGATGSVGKFDYAYDNLGRRTSVAKTGELYARYSGAGLDTQWGYNDRSEVTSEVSKLGGTSTVLTGRDDAYAFDNLGNRSSATRNGTSASYTANALNQYTQRAVPGGIDVTGFAPLSATVTINSSSSGITRQNEWYYRNFVVTNTSSAVWQSLALSSSLGGSATRNAFVALTPEPFTYDDDGNLTSDGRWDYSYDAENRPVAMQTHTALSPSPLPNADARRLEFKNDYLGRRVQKTVRGGWNGSSFTTVVSDEKFVFNGWNPMAKLNAASGNALLASYYWSLDWSGTLQGAGGVGGLAFIVEGGNTYQPVYDGNGNVMGLIKASTGLLEAAYEYDAFGQTLRETGAYAASNPFRFSTKYADTESGHVYYGLRYYSPTLGRFINRDPISESGGLNLYAFCSNNGVNRWDHLGMKQNLSNELSDPDDPDHFVSYTAVDYGIGWSPYQWGVSWNNKYEVTYKEGGEEHKTTVTAPDAATARRIVENEGSLARASANSLGISGESTVVDNWRGPSVGALSGAQLAAAESALLSRSNALASSEILDTIRLWAKMAVESRVAVPQQQTPTVTASDEGELALRRAAGTAAYQVSRIQGTFGFAGLEAGPAEFYAVSGISQDRVFGELLAMGKIGLSSKTLPLGGSGAVGRAVAFDGHFHSEWIASTDLHLGPIGTGAFFSSESQSVYWSGSVGLPGILSLGFGSGVEIGPGAGRPADPTSFEFRK